MRKSDIAKQIELLADMMRSTLPPDEFATEKNVILEEIAMAKDDLDHVAIDFLQEKVFAGHPLGWPVLGYDHTVEALDRDTMWEYFQKHYAPDNMMLVVTGNVDPAEIIGVAEDLCGSWKPSGATAQRVPPTLRTGTDVMTVDRFNQQFLALTFAAPSARDDWAETVAAATTILGGGNSRFYWNIVQQGIATQAGVYYMDYTDCGAVLLYGNCPPENAERLVENMRKEADRICNEPVRENEVERVKNQRRTSLAIEGEAPYHRLTQLLDDMEYHGAPRTVEQMLAAVDAVTVESIREYFKAYPINTEGHLTSVGPRHWPEGNGRT
ncbi:MAG: insulinase family protein [Planctomycetes bacterium]|nr:insulinase family protein [Planctomycetota bacterium]